MTRTRVPAHSAWARTMGYARAVRVGPTIFIGGTTAIDGEGHLVGVGDPGRQMTQILQNLRATLVALGADMADVVQTRIYVTDISQWEAVGAAHGAVFRGVEPVTTLVEVAALAAPEMLVELEAVAIRD